MQKPPDPAPLTPATRAEKMSILSAMLGPDAMERVRETRGDTPDDAGPQKVELDADRVAWHRNRLLQRLRQQGERQSSAPADMQEHVAQPSAQNDRRLVTSVPKNLHLDARLAKISDVATLEDEHPAVITRLIKSLSRDERVEALKSLPGPVARSIVRRLR